MLSEIVIDTDLIPYSFEMELNEVIYTFLVKYNELGDYFTLDLYEEDKPIMYGEKIILAKPLFLPIMYKNAPIILPLDFAFKTDRVTFDNISHTVKLYFVSDNNEILE